MTHTFRFRMPAPTALVVLLPLLAAGCTAGRRGAAAGGEAPTPTAPVDTAAPSADSTTGSRWYGYEGGLEDAEDAARSIAGATQYWQAVEGRWRTDADSGTFTAHVHERRLRRLAVTYGGGRTTGTGTYTYDERARLFHYAGDERRRTGTGRNARTTRTIVSVALDPQGAPSATRKTVGGRAQPLQTAEVATIVERERAARAAAVRSF